MWSLGERGRGGGGERVNDEEAMVESGTSFSRVGDRVTERPSGENGRGSVRYRLPSFDAGGGRCNHP